MLCMYCSLSPADHWLQHTRPNILAAAAPGSRTVDSILGLKGLPSIRGPPSMAMCTSYAVSGWRLITVVRALRNMVQG